VLVVDQALGTARARTCGFAWQMPLAVVFGPGGALFVADGGRGAVARVNTDGTCLEVGKGLLTRPSGLAVLGDRLYVADPPKHEVRFFSLDGAPLGRFGSHGDGPGELNFPTALGVTPDGKLLVVDALNFRVVVTSAEGEPLATFGAAGERGGAFARPKAVAADRHGRLYVSDAQLGAVLMFDPEGRFRLAFNGSGRAPYDLSMPAGVAVSGDRLFVADPYNHRVERYELVEDSP
jgi:sugar lactone lactonase YvrE